MNIMKEAMKRYRIEQVIASILDGREREEWK